MKDKILYLGVGLLFTHELDAIRNHEWLVLPLTSWLPDAFAEGVFVVAHIPLFAIVVAGLASLNSKIRKNSHIGFSLFLVVHGFLHLAFLPNEHYEFESLTSNILIFGGTLCGVTTLWLSRKKPPS